MISVDGSESSGCQLNLTFATLTSRAVNITCGEAQRDFVITPRDAKKLWDAEEVIGRFRESTVASYRYTLPQAQVLVVNRPLNASFNRYVDNITQLLNYSNKGWNWFYYSGDIYNNGSSIEVIN